MHRSRRRLGKLLAACIALSCGAMFAMSPGACAAEAIRLQNARIAVEIDRRTGAILSIRDREQDVTYPSSGIGFEVATKTGDMTAQKAVEARTTKDGLKLRFVGSGLDVTLHYRLGADDHFIEKWLEIKSADGRPYFLQSVALENMTSDAFTEIHFHDDQTIWHCPINLFLRGEKGGCFAGLEYPYWDLKQKGEEGFRLGYTPNYQAGAKEVNISEKYFLGVYRKEGIHRVSQGPYPGRGRSPLVNFSAGLSQHFKGKRIPPVIKDVPLETLDWGEVWAMQEFMRHVLPDDLPLPEEGYWVWQNGWWARLWDPKPEILDLLKQVGIHDIGTAHTWYGRGVHPLSPPYLDKMRCTPMGFPKDLGVAGMPGPGDIAKGLHADQKTAKDYLDKFKENDFTSGFLLPPAMERFHRYGKKIGVHVSSFSVPCMYFHEHPEWASIDEDGKVSEYLFGRKVSCPACDNYMDHMFEILDHVITKYRPRSWGFDGRWLSYWEGGGYRPGPKGAGPDPCYAKNHGHPPGDNRYKEWRNILAFLKKLRERHPKICLESYYGLHRGGPWALRHLNSGYHYFETHGADMNRLQAWHQQNDRFRPVYKNSLDLFGKDPRTFRFNVIAGLGIASYCMVGDAYAGFANKENRDFFMKWRAWATKNLECLTVKRDLFGCPGDSAIDGSAHIIKDRGFLFLHRGGFDKGTNQKTALRASIRVNRWLQLEDSPEALYQIREIYPREGVDLGVYRYGEEFLYDMPEGSAVILSLEPAASGSRPRRAALTTPQGKVVVAPAFSSATPNEPASKPAGKPAAKPAPTNAERAAYRHWPFDEFIDSGAATPDASPNKAHAPACGAGVVRRRRGQGVAIQGREQENRPRRSGPPGAGDAVLLGEG